VKWGLPFTAGVLVTGSGAVEFACVPSNFDGVIGQWWNPDGTTSIVQFLAGNLWFSQDGGNGWRTGSTLIVPGTVNTVMAVLDVSGGVWNIYLNGSLEIAAYSTAITGIGYPYAVGTLPGWNGPVAVFPGALTGARAQSHYLGYSTGYAGDTTATRFKRVAAWAGITNTYAPTGTTSSLTTMPALTSLVGQQVGDVLNTVATTENGQMMVDGQGRLCLLPRSTRYATTTAKWVLGENETGGEIPYEDGLQPTVDPQIIYNDVSITRNGGPTQRAVDATSSANPPVGYGTRTFTRTLYNTSDLETLDATNWILNRYKQPQVRIEKVVVEAISNSSRLPFVLGVAQGDRVTLKRRLNTGFVWSADFFVERIERVGDPTQSISASVQMSPAWYSTAWVLDDAVNSVLDSTTLPAY
jgi:hypothetical protein